MLKNALMFILINIMMLSATYTSFANTSETKQISSFINENARDILTILEGRGDGNAKKQSLTMLFNKIVDIDWMAKFVIAKNWRSMDEVQQQQYLCAYKSYLTNSYVQKFVEYNGQKYNIMEIKEVGNGHFIAVTDIISSVPGKPNMIVSYRIKRLADGGMRVVDIIGEGVSLLSTQRTEFSAMIEKQGIDGLIKALFSKA